MFKFFRSIFLIVVLALPFISQCTGSHTPSPVEEENPSTTKSDITFPLNVGNKWVYAVYDSIDGQRDTAEVSIIDAAYQDSSEFTMHLIWYYKILNVRDTTLIHVKDDTMDFIFGFGVRERLIFPLIPDSTYLAGHLGKYYVSAIDTIHGPLGIFKNVVRLFRKRWEPNGWEKMIIYFVPNMGIVRYEHWMYTTFTGIDAKIRFDLIATSVIEN